MNRGRDINSSWPAAEQYRLDALRTAGPLDLMKGAAGLSGEASELLGVLLPYLAWPDAEAATAVREPEVRQEIQKEFGDVLWYGAIAATYLGAYYPGLMADAKTHAQRRSPFLGALTIRAGAVAVAAGRYLDEVKKIIYHQHPEDKAVLAGLLAGSMGALFELAAQLGLDVEEAAAHNIARLRARYPDGFSSERSLNRGEA